MTTPAAHDVHIVPAPALSLASAAGSLARQFGIDAQCSDLPSERDRNIKVQTADAGYVLKVSNSAEDPAVVDMENQAMEHIARCDPSLPIPRLVRDLAGRTTTTIEGDDGRRHQARLITLLAGSHLEGAEISTDLATQIGAITARTSVALSGFFHPAGGRTHAWDIRRVRELEPKLIHVPDPRQRQVLAQTLARIGPTLDIVATLPGHIEHYDITLINVLADGAGQISGVVDFGDMHHTASVCDLATGLNSVLRSVGGRGWPAVADLASAYLDGYLRHRWLTVAEGRALADLLLARLALTLIVSAWRSGDHPDNTDYIGQYDDASWSLLADLTDQPDLTGAFSRLCGSSRGAAPVAFDPSLRERRDAVVAGSFQPLMYADPLQLARGAGPWLFDTAGRAYLDGYNNVPVVGHANPVVGQAISHQLRLLNINARYLHQHGIELGERLLATMPVELGFDTCILVNSGSEAVDLAWRLATSYTGNSGALIGDTAYHGITSATESFSSNEWPAGHHPDHVATFESPYVRDGRSPDDSEARGRVEAAVAWLAERGHQPALLMADPMFTSAGILDADPAFMTALGAAAADRGALVLADEVQSGFGRTGPDAVGLRRRGTAARSRHLGQANGQWTSGGSSHHPA